MDAHGKAGKPASSGGTALQTGLDVIYDPVLKTLVEAQELYQEAKSSWEDETARLKEIVADLRHAQEMNRQISEELQQAQAQVLKERRRAARQKERARQLAEGLKNVYRSILDGNIFHLILKASIAITGATRGIYLTASSEGGLQVRAAIDVDGHPRNPPSDFLQAVCRRVLENQESLICNEGDCPADVPQPSGPAEDFRNFVVAPVVLLKNLNGIAILADKLDGGFEPEDVETVLSVGDQAAVAVENKQLQAELLASYFSIVGILADAIEAKDAYTHGHCEMVARYACRVAEYMGLAPAERSVTCYGGLLHDIGKIAVSDGVLNKPSQLMPEEWELMRSHVRVGRDLLGRIPVFNRVADVVLHHHKRFDGGGYPDGLASESISLPARIIAVVDAYCAMTAKRSYKEASTPAEARAELIRCKGTHFDPDVVEAFLAILDQPAAVDGESEPYSWPSPFGSLEDFQHALETFPRRLR